MYPTLEIRRPSRTALALTTSRSKCAAITVTKTPLPTRPHAVLSDHRHQASCYMVSPVIRYSSIAFPTSATVITRRSFHNRQSGPAMAPLAKDFLRTVDASPTRTYTAKDWATLSHGKADSYKPSTLSSLRKNSSKRQASLRSRNVIHGHRLSDPVGST